MRTYWLTIAAFALGLLMIASVAHSAAADECLDDLKPALVSGGFSGSLDCQGDRLSISKIGKVQTEGRTFTIYSYRYKLKPACPDCAVHGGQRIIFMDGDRYVGQYRSDFVRAAIRHGVLVLDAANEDPVRVEFTRSGPPDKLLVDGELIELFR